MSKAAFSYSGKRIAPVFDCAREIHVVEVERGVIVAHKQELLTDDLPVPKALRLVELGIGHLVCGAVSRPLHSIILGCGIRVTPFIAGDLQEVIQAWLRGRLDSEIFSMPGCAGWRHRHGLSNLMQEEYPMNRRRCGGSGQGRRQRQGQGLAGNPVNMGAFDAICFCPKCGYREPHDRGVPCIEKQCPQCGTTMIHE